MAQNVWLSTADGNYGTAANWSLGHAPQAGEDVVIPSGSPSITSGFNQAGVAIAAFTVEQGYDGAIGDPAGQAGEYDEIRQEKGMRPGGLGLMLVRGLADELIYNEVGNEVVLVKYLP